MSEDGLDQVDKSTLAKKKPEEHKPEEKLDMGFYSRRNLEPVSADAIEQALKSTAKRAVEQEGRQNGLRGALSARLESWEGSLKHRRSLTTTSRIARPTEQILLKPTMSIAEKAIRLVKNRLKPRSQVTAQAAK